MKNLIARLSVILRAAPTYLVAASVAVSALNEEISKAFPGAAESVGRVAVPLLAAIGAAIAIIRRVTPVSKDERGLL